MPKDTVERDRSRRRRQAATARPIYEEVRYEGYGPGGVAIIVEALTDNRNRTASDVRAAFTKSGGTLGESNSVSFLFDRLGQITYPAAAASGDAMFEAVAEAGADDVESGPEEHVVICAMDALNTVRDALERRFGAPAVGQARVAAWEDRRRRSRAMADAKPGLAPARGAGETATTIQTLFANYEVVGRRSWRRGRQRVIAMAGSSSPVPCASSASTPACGVIPAGA